MNQKKPQPAEAGGSTSARGPILTKAVELKEIPMKWRVYEDLQIRKRSSAVERWVKEKTGTIKTKCRETPWRDSETLKGYVSLHDTFSNDKGMPSSCEVLTDLILRNGSVPRINTFVDVYNVVSVLTGISIGAHDTDQVSGNAQLLTMAQDLSFEPIGGRGNGIAKRGEFAYADDAGVICRMDIKQCDRTKITNKTQNVLVIFQGHAGIGEEMIDDAIAQLEKTLRQFDILK